MSQATKDIICRDRAGIERFVAFGTDIPRGWEHVRDADQTPVPADQLQPRSIANADAVTTAAENLQARADRAAAGDPTVRDTLPDHASKVGEDPGAGEPHGIKPLPPALDDMTVEELQAEADRLGLEVKGTGKDGNVLRKDLESALKAAG
jgi:hypothetical protein